MIKKLCLGKQFRFVTRREEGEQRSWHQANEQRSRPINAVRKPEMFAFRLGLISLLLTGAIASSCVEPSTDNAAQFDEDTEGVSSLLNQALREVREIEIDINRGHVFRSLRERDRQKMQDSLKEIRLAIFRLSRDNDDRPAGQVLKDHLQFISEVPLLQHDEARFDLLIDHVASILDAIGFVIPRELFRTGFDYGLQLFSQVTLEGDIEWVYDELRGAVRASGFLPGRTQSTETWLFSPAFDLSQVQIPFLRLTQTVSFLDSWEDLEVLVASDYQGGHPEQANWQVLEVQSKPQGDVNWETMRSERIDLSAYTGESNVVIAFRYQSIPSRRAATWQFDGFALGGSGQMQWQTIEPSLEFGSGSAQYEALLAASFSESLLPFSSLLVKGLVEWDIQDSRGAAINAFDSGGRNSPQSEAWLVSPVIDLTKAVSARLFTEIRSGFYQTDDDWEVLVMKTNQPIQDTASLDASQWEMLSLDRGSGPNGGSFWSWSHAPASLDEYLGETIVLAFRYRAQAGKASAWEIKNLRIEIAQAD